MIIFESLHFTNHHTKVLHCKKQHLIAHKEAPSSLHAVQQKHQAKILVKYRNTATITEAV